MRPALRRHQITQTLQERKTVDKCKNLVQSFTKLSPKQCESVLHHDQMKFI